MATGTFPPSLPSPMGQFSGEVRSSLRTFVAQSGRVRRSGFSGKKTFAGTFSWNFLPSEYATFETWRKTDQADGTLPFNLTAIFGGTSQTHWCTFYSLPKVTRGCDVWKVGVDARILTFNTSVLYTWAAAFSGRFATFPYTEVGQPEMAYEAQLAQSFLAVGEVPNVAASQSVVGTNYTLTWILTGLEFEYFIDWYSNALQFGQKKFVASFGELGTKLYTVASELQFSMSGLDFRVTMKAQGIDYSAPATNYIINRAQDFSVDTWTNRAQDSSADTYTNKGQP